MPKVYIDEDEFYPYFTISFKKEWSHSKSFKIPKELIDGYNKAQEMFEQANTALSNYIETTKQKELTNE